MRWMVQMTLDEWAAMVAIVGIVLVISVLIENKKK